MDAGECGFAAGGVVGAGDGGVGAEFIESGAGAEEIVAAVGVAGVGGGLVGGGEGIGDDADIDLFVEERVGEGGVAFTHDEVGGFDFEGLACGGEFLFEAFDERAVVVAGAEGSDVVVEDLAAGEDEFFGDGALAGGEGGFAREERGFFGGETGFEGVGF